MYIPSLAIFWILWWEAQPKFLWMNLSEITLIIMDIVGKMTWCGPRGCVRSFFDNMDFNVFKVIFLCRMRIGGRESSKI